MICLTREITSKRVVGEVLMRRGLLSAEDQKVLEDLLWREARGFDGEQRADRFFEELQIEMPYFLLHNYEAENDRGFTHQIDTVVVTPHFVLVVELKNIGGTITYDERTHQFIRTWNGTRLALADPFAQVLRHEMFVERVLWDTGVELPIVSAVIITSASSILEAMPPQFHIFKLAGLHMKLQQWTGLYPAQISEDMVCLVKDELMRRYKPRKWRHPFGDVPMKRGALCECGLVMYYARGRFSCACGLSSRDVLFQGLHDYRILVSEWITNKEFRTFFLIESKDIANKILKRSGFHYEGGTKSRRYLIPKDVWRN